MQQYYKMEKKIACGAEFLITQVGWDWRKSLELFTYLKEAGLTTPVLGNVYLLSTLTPAPRLMHDGKLPGCFVSDELLAKVQSEKIDDHLERAAQQVALYRALGAAGVDIGGVPDFEMFLRILHRAAEIGSAWEQFKDNLSWPPRSEDRRPRTRTEGHGCKSAIRNPQVVTPTAIRGRNRQCVLPLLSPARESACDVASDLRETILRLLASGLSGPAAYGLPRVEKDDGGPRGQPRQGHGLPAVQQQRKGLQVPVVRVRGVRRLLPAGELRAVHDGRLRERHGQRPLRRCHGGRPMRQ